MEISTKSFALSDFLVELVLRDNVLTIKAENQTTWKLFTLNLTDLDVKSRLGHICSGAQELYLALSDAFIGLFPEINVSLSNNGQLTYVSTTKIGTQQRKTKFVLELEEKKIENLAKYEKYFAEINAKLRDQEREICRLNIALQQSEKKRLDEKALITSLIEVMNKRLEVTEKGQKRIEEFLKIPHNISIGNTSQPAGINIPATNQTNQIGIKRQVQVGPLIPPKQNNQALFNNPNPFESKQSGQGTNTKSFQKQNTLPNPKVLGAPQGNQVSNQTFVPSFRGSLTPAPNSSKSNFVFWGISSETATSPNQQRGAQTPGNNSSRPNPAFWSGIGYQVKQVSSSSSQNPLVQKTEASSKGFFPTSETSSLFGPNKEVKPHAHATPLLTPPKSVDKEKSASLFTASPDSGKFDERNSIIRNFSFQQEVEEKKEEEDEGSEQENSAKSETLEKIIAKIEKDAAQKQGDGVEIILDKLPIRKFREEVVTAIEKYNKSILFLSLNACLMNSLDNFPNLPSLVRLELTDNLISGKELTKLSNLTTLQALSLGGNPIGTFQELESLSKLQELVQLDLLGSPLSDLPDYRTKVFSLFKNLQILDNLDIEGNEIDYDAVSEEANSASLKKESDKPHQEQSKEEAIATKS